MKNYLQNFFAPDRVVIVGASSTPGKPGNDVIRNIQANGFAGDIYLVNPKGGEILGIKVHRAIQDLPENIDLAVIILPAKDNPEVVRQCAAKGIKAVVLAAGGFSEVNREGEILQEELQKAIRETGIRALGPNTSGHTSMPHQFTSSFFPLGKIPKGPISYIAQTGNFATHTMRSIATEENYGVARVVGLGNKLDIDECDILEFYAEDPETKAIFIYLESFKRPKRFMEIAGEVTQHKPVILLKGGSTQSGAKAAIAHTASMAADDKVIDAALRKAGIVRIHEYSHLILAAKVLACMPLPQGNNVSFLAPSGAQLVCLTDLCTRDLNLNVPDVDEATVRRLQEISPSFIRMRNPVDIWPAASVTGVREAYQEAIDAVLKDSNIDAVVVVLMLTDETGVPPLDFLVELARKYKEKPLLVTFSGEKKHREAAKAFLEPRGIPTFPLIEEPFKALSILVKCRQAMMKRLAENKNI